MGYLPVRNAALFGVQIESGVTSCRRRAPCSANRSIFGVFIVSLPKQPRSAIPRSSTRNTRTLGFANATLNISSEKITVNQVAHILLAIVAMVRKAPHPWWRIRFVTQSLFKHYRMHPRQHLSPRSPTPGERPGIE